jgi:hypothetical protein
MALGAKLIAGARRETTMVDGMLCTERGTWHGSRRDLVGGAVRLAAGGALAAALARYSIGQTLAQGTPAAAMNYPELTVTVVDDPATGQAFQVSPSQIPAGYVLLTAVNQSKADGGVGLIGPGPGQTMQDLMQEAATPTAGNGFPAFFATATLPGGPIAVPPGGSAQTIVQLTAGDWGLWGGSESSNPPPVFITAAAGTPTAQPAPTATVTITEVDFAFGGFGVSIPAGKQLWEVRNEGTQPHMLSVSKVPDGTTLVQVMAALNQPPNETPSPGGLTQADFQDMGGVILQSAGTTAWPLFDLPAGRYSAICFMDDPRTGQPHFMEGMVAVFDVGAS